MKTAWSCDKQYWKSEIFITPSARVLWNEFFVLAQGKNEEIYGTH
jgi:hypothetical protein